MKYIFTCVLLLISSATIADNFYLDINYENGSLVLPEKSSKIVRFFSDTSKTLMVTATILKRDNGSDTILLPPTLLEKFELVGDKLKRIKSNDVLLQKSYFKIPTEQIILKVDFYSINKSNASAFSKGLIDMATAYAGTSVSPGVSSIAQAAISLMGTALLDNEDVSLTYIGGINLNNGQYEKKLYFDETGKIENDSTGEQNTAATLTFNINGYEERAMFNNLRFKEQVSDGKAKLLFDEFNSIKNKDSVNKKIACNKLSSRLHAINTITSAEHLLAIAINTAQWPQDETNNSCISAKKARSFRVEYGLEYIANCISDTCLNTKKILLRGPGVASLSDLSIFTGGVDLKLLPCFRDLNINSMSRWKGFKTIDNEDGAATYNFNTCLKSDGDSKRYSHIMSWLNNKVFSHSCVIAKDDGIKCL